MGVLKEKLKKIGEKFEVRSGWNFYWKIDAGGYLEWDWCYVDFKDEEREWRERSWCQEKAEEGLRWMDGSL